MATPGTDATTTADTRRAVTPGRHNQRRCASAAMSVAPTTSGTNTGSTNRGGGSIAILHSKQATLPTPSTTNSATGNPGRRAAPLTHQPPTTAVHSAAPTAACTMAGVALGSTQAPTEASVSFRLVNNPSADVP